MSEHLFETEEPSKFFTKMEDRLFGDEECVFKKCCEKYKKKQKKHCKKCPRK